MVLDEIRGFLADYFDVLQNQRMELFDRVFHKNCVLYSRQDGATVVRPFDKYREMVSTRKSPEEAGATRHDEILMIDLLSDEMAVVKVRLRLFSNTMIDHLNIMKTEAGWMIFAKFFHRNT